MRVYGSVFLTFVVFFSAGATGETTTFGKVVLISESPTTGKLLLISEAPTTENIPAAVTVNIGKALNDTIENQSIVAVNTTESYSSTPKDNVRDYVTKAPNASDYVTKAPNASDYVTKAANASDYVTKAANASVPNGEELRGEETLVMAESQVDAEKNMFSMVYRQPGESSPHVFSRLVPSKEIIWPERMNHPEDSLMCFEEGQMHHLWSSAGDLDCLICVCLKTGGYLHPKCATCAICSPTNPKNPHYQDTKSTVDVDKVMKVLH